MNLSQTKADALTQDNTSVANESVHCNNYELICAHCKQTPEHLISQINNTRCEIVDTLVQVNHIALRINPLTSAEYLIKIGCYEHELLQITVWCKRAQRRLDIAKLNESKGFSKNVSEIEKRLDHEFKVWEDRVHASRDKILNAMERYAHGRLIPDTKRNESIDPYTTLISRLHPDFHAKINPETIEFFKRAQHAYAHDDFATLQGLVSLTNHMALQNEQARKLRLDSLSCDELSIELSLMQHSLDSVQKKLNNLRCKHSGKLSRNLKDENWVNHRVSALKKEIDYHKSHAQSLESKFAKAYL